MAQYTITAVSEQVRPVPTKFGDMSSYKVKLEGVDQPVEILQKKETRPPFEGDVLNGHIEETQYGPKFKKEQAFGGGGGGFTQTAATPPSKPTASNGSSKGFDNDPFTMYLSYAKDIAVAHITSNKGVLDVAAFGESLEHVILGGKTLYDNRPGGTLGENDPRKNENDPRKNTEPTSKDFKDAIELFDLKPDDTLPADF